MNIMQDDFESNESEMGSEEPKELTQQEINEVKIIVEGYINNSDLDLAVNFLEIHPNYSSEFCLQILEAYPNDAQTAVLEISKVIEGILLLEEE